MFKDFNVSSDDNKSKNEDDFFSDSDKINNSNDSQNQLDRQSQNQKDDDIQSIENDEQLKSIDITNQESNIQNNKNKKDLRNNSLNSNNSNNQDDYHSNNKSPTKEEYQEAFDAILLKHKDKLIKKGEHKEHSKINENMYNQDNSYKLNNKMNHNNFLYKDASKRKEKREKMEYNNLMNIKISSTKSKISKNSHKIAIAKTEKIIDELIDKYKKEEYITFIGIGEILSELKIFRIILNKNEDKNKDNKVYLNFKDIQNEMINIKESDKRKQKEVEFYEQFWFIINPGHKDKMKADILSEILKILFAPINSGYKETSEIFKKFLMTAFFLNSNPNEVKEYISPITQQKINEDDIWSIEKLVREFMSLKENILAYKNVKHPGKDTIFQKQEEKKLFKPKINPSKLKNNFYSERLPNAVKREQFRLQVLEEMKKENEDNEIKECSFKPEINKTKLNKNSNEKNENNEDIYNKLYNRRKEKQEKIDLLKTKINQQHKKNEEIYTFKPKLISQQSYLKATNSTELPKGYEDYVNSMREASKKNQKLKETTYKIITGQNYEKTKKEKIVPFDITDLKKKDDSNKDNSNKEFFTVQIKIPSGKETLIKVYLNEDPYIVAENFCKIYSLNEEILKRLSKMILDFRNIYIKKNISSNTSELPQSKNNEDTDSHVTSQNI